MPSTNDDAARKRPDLMLCAAFQGGGSKAIAYAGALAALEEAGYGFKAVAGTSAGSIVATLVAAGFSSAEVTELIPVLLQQIRRVKGRARSDIRKSGVYTLEGMRSALELHLRRKVRGDDSADENDVTFSELFNATGIELNVLVTRSPGLPSVLNVYSAPDCQISYAVAASSAIPLVIAPQLLNYTFATATVDNEAAQGSSAERVLTGLSGLDGRLQLTVSVLNFLFVDPQADQHGYLAVDGGVWANYPALCFTDRSLRHYYNAPSLAGHPVVGFILDTTPSDDEPVRQPRRLGRRWRAIVDDPVGTANGLYSLLSLTGLIATVLAGCGIYFIWSENVLGPGWSGISLRVLGTVILGWVGLFNLIPILLSDFIAASMKVVPTLLRGLTSVTVGVPEWTGADPETHVIRVPASRNLITTTNFAPDPTVIQQLTAQAQEQVAAHLRDKPLHEAHKGRRGDFGHPDRFTPATARSPRPVQTSDIGRALDKLGMK